MSLSGNLPQQIHIPLYAIRHGKIGGTEFAIYNLIRGLAEATSNTKLYYGSKSDLSGEFLKWGNLSKNISFVECGNIPGPKGVRFLQESVFEIRRSDRQWAIYPNYFCPISFRKTKRCVILHDIQYKRYPEYHSKKRRQWLDLYLPKMLRYAESIILISESELSLVREYFGDDVAARCDVVHNAIDFCRFNDSDLLASPEVRRHTKHRYILSVCHNFPHKNVRTIIDAFIRLAKSDQDLHLYLVGATSTRNRELVVADVPDYIRKRIHLTGFITDADLGVYYANARMFVLPSLYEGFGMPAVEALGLGVPTLVSNAYALPEVTMGYAGLIDDPLDVTTWTAAMEAMLASDIRPSADQILHIRASYHPTTIANRLLSVLARREQDL